MIWTPFFLSSQDETRANFEIVKFGFLKGGYMSVNITNMTLHKPERKEGYPLLGFTLDMSGSSESATYKVSGKKDWLCDVFMIYWGNRHHGITTNHVMCTLNFNFVFPIFVTRKLVTVMCQCIQCACVHSGKHTRKQRYYILVVL